VTNLNYRFKADGPRRLVFDYDTWAYTGGFEGTFELAGRILSWDATYQYLQQNYDSGGINFVNLFHLRNALGPSFRDAGGVLRCGTPGNVLAGCIPFNVFGGPDLGQAAGVVTAAEATAMIDYVAYELVQTREVNVTNYTANVTGDLFDLPAGPLAFAAGYEYRGTDGKFQPDSLIAEGGSSTNFTETTTGNQNVDEFYGELSVPLLADVRFAEVLDLSLAGRYSDYSSDGVVGLTPATAELGDTTNFKAGFRWKPIADLLLRGNWAETFRAPSVADLFGGGSESFGTINDPCRNALAGAPGNTNLYATLTPDQQQSCVDQGVPPGGYVQEGGGFTRFLFGGNRFLDPELGTNRTLGVVYSPSWLEGLDVYLDWYRVELESALSEADASTIVNRCIRNGEELFCNFIERIPGGEISELRVSEFNASLIEVEGWDAGFAYRRDTAWGRFDWALNVAYLSKAQFTAEAGDEPDDFVGEGSEFGLGTWRLRSNFVTSWTRGDWDATWNLRYLSPLEEDCTGDESGFEEGVYSVDFCDPNPDGPEASPSGVNRAGSVTYHDFQVGWSAPWNARVAIGVRNAFDKQPPIGYFAFANSTLMGYDLPDSRFWYASYSQKF
jgi:outer membrane receptor protein involved in Fe transport